MAAADQDSPDLRALLRAELAAAEAKAAVLREYLGEEANDAASVVTSASDFKARTGHSPRTVVEAIRAGDLPATKVTRGYRVTVADLRERSPVGDRRVCPSKCCAATPLGFNGAITRW